MSLINTFKSGRKFKLNEELSNNSQIVYNTRLRNKQKRRKRIPSGSNLSGKSSQHAHNSIQTEDMSSDDDVMLDIGPNTKFIWSKNNDNDDLITPMDLWADYTDPLISYPLCTLDSLDNHREDMDPRHPIIFVNTISLDILISEIYNQISQIENELFCDFNWDKISTSCGLNVRACKGIWWSLDDRAIPILDGYLIILDMLHYKEIEPRIILQCKKRVKSIINFSTKYNLNNVIS